MLSIHLLSLIALTANGVTQDNSLNLQSGPNNAPTQSTKITTGYKVHVLHDLLTIKGLRCAVACPKSCEPSVVCTHDTLNSGPRGHGYERLVYRTSSARISTWGLPRYELVLTYQLRRLLRQDYMHDSLMYVRILTGTNSASVAWSQSSLLSAVLLVTPRRDSLLYLRTELMRGRIEEEDSAVNLRRTDSWSEAIDSSYCFLLKAGRLKLVSSRNFYNRKQPTYLIEHRLLAARQKGLIPQMKAGPSRKGSRLHIDDFILSKNGLIVHYRFVDSDGGTVPSGGLTEVTIPYEALPVEVLNFSTL